MRFIGEGVGELVSEMLGKASKVQLATAYFSPSKPHMARLLAIKELDIVVSAEFEFNNPHTLEKLTNANRRSINSDPKDRKLHAKVLIMRLRDNSDWILLGSANLTHQGMFSNREACVELRSGISEDRETIASIKRWYKVLIDKSDALDLEAAKKIWALRSRYHLVPRDVAPSNTQHRYWALKSTEGPQGTDHWEEFYVDQVVAIGWGSVNLNLSDGATAWDIRRAVDATFPNESSTKVAKVANKIYKFVHLSDGDVLVICGGYNAKQKTVVVKGLARVDGPFQKKNQTAGKWRFRHKAIVRRVDLEIPRDAIVEAIGKKTLLETIHELSPKQFEKLSDLLRSEGATIDI